MTTAMASFRLWFWVTALSFVFLPAHGRVAQGEIIHLNSWGTKGSGNGQFEFPVGVAIAPTGEVYVADSLNDRIQKFDNAGGFIDQWGTKGSENGQFVFPQDVSVAPTGEVYVADTNNHRIQKFDNAGAFIDQWGAEGSGNGQFVFPQGVAVAPTGEVYVFDDSNRIQKFDSAGRFIDKWGTKGSGNGQFQLPKGIAVAPTGEVYVFDSSNSVQKFDNAGVFIERWDTVGSGNGPFEFPIGITVANTSEVYIADFLNDRIQKFDNAGRFIDQWGGPGAGNGQFQFPQDVAVAPTGEVYVADANNHRIQRFFDTEAWVSGRNPISDDLRIGSTEPFSDSLSITAERSLEVPGTTTILPDGRLLIAGGTLTTNSLETRPKGQLSFRSGTLHVTGGGGLSVGNAFGGQLTLGETATLLVDNTTLIKAGEKLVVDGGTFSSDLLVIESDGEFRAQSQHINYNEVLLQGITARISGSELTNSGVISGHGRITANIHNTSTGRLSTDKRLVFTGEDNVNDGVIVTDGGEIEFFRNLNNNHQLNVVDGLLRVGRAATNTSFGFLSGQGRVRFHFDGGLSNRGMIGLNFATASVIGRIANEPSGIISLAGGSSVSFIGDLTNDGTVSVGNGSQAIFTGRVSGTGDFTGGGTVEIAGGFSPGGSPGVINFGGNLVLGSSSNLNVEMGGNSPGSEYDQVNVAGTLSLGGTLNVVLIDDFVPQLGDTFQVFNFDSIDGVFRTINLPAIPNSDYAWDVSSLLTMGQLVVIVPEPGSALLTATALLCLFSLYRWRSSLSHFDNGTRPKDISVSDAKRESF